MTVKTVGSSVHLVVYSEGGAGRCHRMILGRADGDKGTYRCVLRWDSFSATVPRPRGGFPHPNVRRDSTWKADDTMDEVPPLPYLLLRNSMVSFRMHLLLV